MSVIQNIQEKYAKLMAVIIAVALIIFVVMLAFENGGNLFRGGNSTAVGKVNGKSIEYAVFSEKVEQAKSSMAQQGYPEEMAQQQAFESAWEQEVNQTILESEANKLGIKVGKKELGDILYGSNPPEFLKQQFTDTATGVFNAQQAKIGVDQLLKLKAGNEDQMRYRDYVISFVNYLENKRLQDKYTSLLANSMYVPKWLVEKENADRSQIASISLVREYYAAVNDTTIKITDKEIADYISKHKDDYKQPESRSIAYVTFSALPSAADSADALKRVTEVKSEFDTVKNVASFLSRNGSAVPYSEVYAGKSLMQMPNKDIIQSLPVNGVYGPYLDGDTYTLAKLLDVKQLPDSVKCRHVLISNNAQEGGFEDSVAAKKIDSVKKAIDAGAPWADMVEKYNPQTDGSRQSKGEMTFSSTQIQGENFAKEFAQFILFDGKPGDKKIVKTSFGHHYIEIMNFIKVEPHYKVAYMAKRIEISPETESSANNDANQFAGDSRDQKSFDANVEKLKARGINKLVATDIAPTAFNVQSLGTSRTFVKNIYKADKGDVLDPEKIGDNYVVAIVTEVNEEGTMSPAKARISVEPILKNKKKAQNLIKKLGSPASLEAAATALGGKPIERIDSLRLSGQQLGAATSLGQEPKVLGASFNPANKGKITVIEGGNAVYVIRVENVMAIPLADADVAQQRKSRYEQAKQQVIQQATYSPVGALRQAAKVKDKRSEFF